MRRFWQRHISEGDLAALADGGAATAPQESHLAGCPRCAERLAAHRRIGRALATEWVNTTVSVPHARTAPRAALALPVAALAAVLAAALVFRGIGGPATPSQTPTVGLASETGSRPPTPPPTPSPLPSPVVPVELPADGLTMNSIHWSPDGKHVIYAGLGWELLDDAGTLLKRVPLATPHYVDVMYEGAWLDSSHYAIGAEPGTVTIYGLDGSEVQPPVVYRGHTVNGPGIVGNGRGALSVAAAPTSFVVWANGSASKDVPGFPLRWSPDGTRLLVATSSAQDPGSMADGAWWDTVALVSYPDLEQTATFEGIQLVANVDQGPSIGAFLEFSPDGRSVLSTGTRRQSAPGSTGAAILDAATGRTTFVPDKLGAIGWLPNSRLLVRPMTVAPGPLQEWDGSSLSPSDLPPTTLSVSPTGALAVAASTTDQNVIRFVVDGTTIMDLQESAMEIDWSPDGSHLILVGQPPDVAWALSLISLR